MADLPQDVPDGPDSPLSAAFAARDRETMELVRESLAKKNVVLAYQPVVQSSRPGHVAFYEGLIRLLDSSGRVIPAGEFIGAVEKTELGRRIDTLALEIGLRTLAEQPQIRLSINMSARSMGYPPWNAALKRGLSRDATIGERLILEVTEGSAMLMPDIVQVFMEDLQSQGVAFALDDFGAGYTSFAYLRDFYFDIVKIDGQFIRGIHAQADNQVLAQALVAIARHFEMFTVAESVETAEDARFLSGIGVDCQQGYFYGAPATRPPWLAKTGRMRRAG